MDKPWKFPRTESAYIPLCHIPEWVAKTEEFTGIYDEVTVYSGGGKSILGKMRMQAWLDLAAQSNPPMMLKWMDGLLTLQPMPPSQPSVPAASPSE